MCASDFTLNAIKASVTCTFLALCRSSPILRVAQIINPICSLPEFEKGANSLVSLKLATAKPRLKSKLSALVDCAPVGSVVRKPLSKKCPVYMGIAKELLTPPPLFQTSV